MKKHFTILTALFLLIAVVSEAQYPPPPPPYGYGYRPRPKSYPPPQHRKTQKKKIPKFEPTLNFSAGYGYPNLDKDQFAQFSDAYMGNTLSQNGPFTGAIDYQFSRNMSIGVMGTYGKITVPYYDYSSSGETPDFTGHLENWSLMLDLVTYFPTNNRTNSAPSVEPYLRTAIGFNNWKQEYVDASGNKAALVPDPTQFAYQASLGARFNLSKGAGIYVEAGYGKYIVNGGLTLKF